MKRFITVAIVAALLSSSQAHTQQATAKPSPQTDSTVTALVGTWEGSVYTDHAPEMALKITFTKGHALGATVSITSGGTEYVDGESTELKVDGTAIAWKQGLMQTSCKANAVLISGALKGTFDCGGGGATFLAKKKQ